MYRVALIYNGTQPLDLKVMSGVARYRHECGELITYIKDDFPNHRNIADISAWDGDGVIGNFDSPSIAAAITQAKLPAVAFGGRYSAFPCGFENFAFLGYSRALPSDWSGERQDAFVAGIEESGHPCTIHQHEQAAARPVMM